SSIARANRVGARRRRQRPAAIDEINLRSPCAHRSAGRDKKLERIQCGGVGALYREPTFARRISPEKQRVLLLLSHETRRHKLPAKQCRFRVQSSRPVKFTTV